MSELEAKLKRLVPNTGALDREALLYSAAFAAGKAAGRRPWMRLSGALAVGIVCISCVWIDSSRLPTLPPNALVPMQSVSPATTAPTGTYHPEPTSYIALMQHMGEDRPAVPEGSGAQPLPPLTPRSRID